MSNLKAIIEARDRKIQDLERSMKENSGKDQADVSRLERIIEARDFKVKSLQDQVDCHKEVEHDLQTRIKIIERLEENLQDQERENSRLRTENVQLKNKEKPHVAKKLSGTTPLEIADAIVSLTDAVELINLRLEKHESMLPGKCHPTSMQLQYSIPDVSSQSIKSNQCNLFQIEST